MKDPQGNEVSARDLSSPDYRAFVTSDYSELNRARLEYLRGEIRAERISWGELAELQSLADEIPSDDVELLEWAGVPEHEADETHESPDTFRLVIELGNEEMQSPKHISDALRRAASRIDADEHYSTEYLSGVVRDANGNTCGNYGTN